MINARRKISWVLFLMAIAGIAAGVMGCSDVLAGYDMDYMHAHYSENNPIPGAILNDVQHFVASKKIPASEISDVTFGGDHEGRHVALIRREIPQSRGRDFKEYILYYNKENERTKVRTFQGTREEGASSPIGVPTGAAP